MKEDRMATLPWNSLQWHTKGGLEWDSSRFPQGHRISWDPYTELRFYSGAVGRVEGLGQEIWVPTLVVTDSCIALGMALSEPVSSSLKRKCHTLAGLSVG